MQMPDNAALSVGVIVLVNLLGTAVAWGSIKTDVKNLKDDVEEVKNDTKEIRSDLTAHMITSQNEKSKGTHAG